MLFMAKVYLLFFVHFVVKKCFDFPIRRRHLPQPATVAGFRMLTEQIALDLAGSGFRHAINKLYFTRIFIGGGDGFDVLLQIFD